MLDSEDQEELKLLGHDGNHDNSLEEGVAGDGSIAEYRIHSLLKKLREPLTPLKNPLQPESMSGTLFKQRRYYSKEWKSKFVTIRLTDGGRPAVYYYKSQADAEVDALFPYSL